MKKNVQVNYIESFGTQDGPGVRMVVFTQGCKMRCLYCQNPDTLPFKGGISMTTEQLMEKTLRQKEYFGTRGGVTISGGEPLLHAQALIPYFKALHKEGINTALDTNGFVWNEHVEELLQHTDYVLLDIKHIDPKLHKRLTKVDIQPILDFANKIKDYNVHLWVRYVLVPGWNDKEEHLRAWAKFVHSLGKVERVELLPYHSLGVPKYLELQKDYKLHDTPSPSAELKENTRKIFEEEGLTNIVVK